MRDDFIFEYPYGGPGPYAAERWGTLGPHHYVLLYLRCTPEYSFALASNTVRLAWRSKDLDVLADILARIHPLTEGRGSFKEILDQLEILGHRCDWVGPIDLFWEATKDG